jgi:hypothetical protein
MLAQFERFTIEMTKAQAVSASHPGPCDKEVDHLLTLPKIKQQLKRIPDEFLADVLHDYGIWEDKTIENKEQRMEAEQYIIWIAAGDIAEGRN